MSTTGLTHEDIEAAGIPDWRLLARAIHTRFQTKDFVTGLSFVNAVGELAEEAGHHPDLDLRYTHLDIALMTHAVGAVTHHDVDLARQISAVAAERGIVARPERVARVEIGLDTADREAQLRFWAAVLDVEPTGEYDVIDPTEQLPTLWFQDTDPHDEPRQRFHLDLWVPVGLAQQRIDAALAAGGTMVDSAQAPAFWVLADPEGNKVCICTSESRSPDQDAGGTQST